MNRILKKVAFCSFLAVLAGLLLLVLGVCFGGHLGMAIDLKEHEVYTEANKDYIEDTKSLSAFNSISVKGGIQDISIVTGEEYKVEYYLRGSRAPKIEVSDHTLTLNTKKPESDSNFGVNFIDFFLEEEKDNYICITVPENVDLKNVTVNLEAGDIKILDSSLENVKLDLEAGDLSIENSSMQDVQCILECGDLSIENSSIQDVRCILECGDIKLQNSTFNNLAGKLESGDFKMISVVADKLQYESEYGDVKIADSTIDQIVMKGESSDVDIRLHGSLNDYDLDIVTDDEDVKINGESQGDVIKIDHGRQKRIQLETEYGDVKIVIQ